MPVSISGQTALVGFLGESRWLTHFRRPCTKQPAKLGLKLALRSFLPVAASESGRNGPCGH